MHNCDGIPEDLCIHRQYNPWGDYCYFCILEKRIENLEKLIHLKEKDRIMDVMIKLNDVEGAIAVISNTEDEKYIWISLKIIENELTAKLSIEELWHALRKLTAK